MSPELLSSLAIELLGPWQDGHQQLPPDEALYFLLEYNKRKEPILDENDVVEIWREAL